jgi:hypothetical protein
MSWCEALPTRTLSLFSAAVLRSVALGLGLIPEGIHLRQVRIAQRSPRVREPPLDETEVIRLHSPYNARLSIAETDSPDLSLL